MGKKILLTGAGFSKAFNGYLCNELTAYFFNTLAVDIEFREDLLKLRPFDRKNFETLLSDFRRKYKCDQDKITKIEKVLGEIFQKMCDGMRQNDDVVPINSVAHFFYEFDHVFTINQDAIHNQNQADCSNKKKFSIDETMSGCGTWGNEGSFIAPRSVISDTLLSNILSNGRRAYLELHGAYDWPGVFILGDSSLPEEKKIGHIRNNPTLSSYFDFFEKFLRENGSKLVIVGYGFLDQHINEAIAKAINSNNGLEIFIWDPSAEIYLEGRKKNVEVRGGVVSGPEDSLDGLDKNLLQKGLRGYLPKRFSLEGSDKEDVKRFLKTNQ